MHIVLPGYRGEIHVIGHWFPRNVRTDGYLRYFCLLSHRDRQSICHCHQVFPWQRLHGLLHREVDLYLLMSCSDTHVLPDPLPGLVPTESGVLDFPRTTTPSNVQGNCRDLTSAPAISGFPGRRTLTSKLSPAHSSRVCLRVLVLSRLFRRQLLQSHQLMQRIYYQTQLAFLVSSSSTAGSILIARDRTPLPNPASGFTRIRFQIFVPPSKPAWAPSSSYLRTRSFRYSSRSKISAGQDMSFPGVRIFRSHDKS